MLASLFQEWFQYFDKEVTKKHGDNRVISLIDNCPSHIQHVDVHYFPPNTTTKIQPMAVRYYYYYNLLL